VGDGTIRVAPNADMARMVHSTLVCRKEIIPTFMRDVGGSLDLRLPSNLPRFLLSIYIGYRDYTDLQVPAESPFAGRVDRLG